MIYALRAAVDPGRRGPAAEEPIVVPSATTQEPEEGGEPQAAGGNPDLCPVCHGVLVGREGRWPGGCAHSFHEQCLAQLLAHGTEYCPICRIGVGRVPAGARYSMWVKVGHPHVLAGPLGHKGHQCGVPV